MLLNKRLIILAVLFIVGIAGAYWAYTAGAWAVLERHYREMVATPNPHNGTYRFDQNQVTDERLQNKLFTSEPIRLLIDNEEARITGLQYDSGMRMPYSVCLDRKNVIELNVTGSYSSSDYCSGKDFNPPNLYQKALVFEVLEPGKLFCESCAEAELPQHWLRL